MKLSKKIAFSSILTAISVILMLIGSFFGSLDLTTAALASFCVILAVIEMGPKSAILIYVVSSVLAIFILPLKTPALYFLIFLGYYPVLKYFAEKLSKIISYVIKFISYSVSFAVLAVITLIFLVPEANVPAYLIPAIYVGGGLVFFIYDLALSRVIGMYYIKLRKRLGLNKFLGNDKK